LRSDEHATVDPQEVAFYSRLAEQWWDEKGSFWPLHRLNRLRVSYLHKAICDHFGRTTETQQPLAGLSVLDIGCGGGILAESMARLGASVHRIDVVERNIEVAHGHARQSGLAIRYEQVDIKDVVERGRQYDVVLNMEVIEHVANLPLFMSLCTRLVTNNGILFVATINRNLLSWLFAIVGAEYVLRWLPIGTHRWRKFVKPAELESLLTDNGLEVSASTGVQVNPFNRKFSLSPRKQVNYMLTATRHNS
jgi:2-polyprenyl-6-hydroxyphenyl methylase/3-demethylubiquinone-9 3-methyltransferase